MIFQLNLRQSGRHIYIAEEAKGKDKKEGNDGGKKGAANVKICALLLNNSASGQWDSCGESWMRKKKDGKERKTPQLHHTRIGLHGCSQTLCPGKGGNLVH